jgi:hypothetical protein
LLNPQQLRKYHPGWQLLAATKGPVLIGVLQNLFKDAPEGIDFDSAVLNLSQVLKSQREKGELDLNDFDSRKDSPSGVDIDYALEARREIRLWIKRGLLQERQGIVIATDALESAIRFVQSLEQRFISSSASRLAIVQREIEHLEANLNPSPVERADFIKQKIAALEIELANVEQGNVDVLPENQAVESIREIYTLATSLSNDFRRVEDSYREADQRLRQSIIAEQSHRGEIVDKLLDSHDALLETSEGKVFMGFHQQLARKIELDRMKLQLRVITKHPHARKALSPRQQSDLKWLIMRLVKESERVMQARSRSEKDVRGFLKTGLAAEHHRVGQLLNDVFAQAINIDWSAHKFRRLPGPFPPVAINNYALPLVERIRFKEWKTDIEEDLDLLPKDGQIDSLEDDFWQEFEGLNQAALYSQTMDVLANSQKSPMAISELCKAIEPSHDLESIALWLAMAMASESLDTSQGQPMLTDYNSDQIIGLATEQIEMMQKDQTKVQFTVPIIKLTQQAMSKIDFEI